MLNSIYKIICIETGEAEKVFMGGCPHKSEFSSASDARTSNCWGVYRDRSLYKISQYNVTYELIDDDVRCNEETPFRNQEFLDLKGEYENKLVLLFHSLDDEYTNIIEAIKQITDISNILRIVAKDALSKEGEKSRKILFKICKKLEINCEEIGVWEEIVDKILEKHFRG